MIPVLPDAGPAMDRPPFEVDHDASPRCVQPEGPALGSSVTLVLRTRGPVDAVGVRHSRDGDPRFLPAVPAGGPVDGWQAWSVAVPMANPVVRHRWLVASGQRAWSVTATGAHAHEVSDADDFTVTVLPGAPTWVAAGTTYQVFPDRFAIGRRHTGELPDWAVPTPWDEPVAHGTPHAMNQWYGGDLWGVAERLDDMMALGTTTLYLTPFFPAASNHRYDATTFAHVDPLLGGDEALRHLTQQAAARGIHVIGDLTLHHTGSGHEWFETARRDPDSVENGFYFLSDDRTSWAGFFDLPSMPKLNHASAELRRRLYDGPDSVVAHYVRDLGLSGWRIDVAQSAGIHGAVDDAALVARLTRRTLDDLAVDMGRGEGFYLVAELQHDYRALVGRDGWQATMDYAGFTRPVWSWLTDGHIDHHWGQPFDFGRFDGIDLVRGIETFAGSIPWSARLAGLHVVDSHDTPRLRTVAGRTAQHLAAVLAFTLPGVPMVYAGDEVGLEGVNMEDSRRPWPPVEQHDTETLALYRRLAALRAAHGSLRTGGIHWLHVDADTVAFVRAPARADEGRPVLVLADRSCVVRDGGSADRPADLAPADLVSRLRSCADRDGRWTAGDVLVQGAGFVVCDTLSASALTLPTIRQE